MTKFFNSVLAAINTIEHSIRHTLKITPIENQRSGYLNTFTLLSGIITIIIYTILLPNYLNYIIGLTVVSLLIFVLSTWINSNHYIHTLATIWLVINIFKLLTLINLNSLEVVNLVLISGLLACLYFDLLKPNFVLQISSIAILNILFNQIAILFLPNLKPPQIALTSLPSFDAYFNPSTIPFLISQLIFVIGLYLISFFARSTGRVSLSNFIHIIYNIYTLMILILITISFDNWVRILALLIFPIIALGLSLHNNTKWSQIYLVSFFVGLVVILIDALGFNSPNGMLILLVIFSIMTIFTHLAKTMIDINIHKS
jgi:hypothetical protein